MPQRVVITRRIPPPGVERLRAAGLLPEEFPSDDPPSRAELLSRVRDVAAIVAMLSERIDAELLDAAGAGLRVVSNFAVGIDNVDLAACRARNVRVTNTPGVLTEATADIAWALILAAARRVAEGDRLVRAGEWRGWTPTQLLGLEMNGATLGVIGAGRIGTAVARRSAGFGMRVLYSHPRDNPELDGPLAARRVELDVLLRESDVVSLHIPMRPENRHLLSRERLSLLKPTAILINTARGAVVDEAALVDLLRAGHIAAAGLDVYEREPALAPGLAELPNVVLVPHLGSATTATRGRMSAMVAENVCAVLTGREPPNPVV
ncbi:MAG: putative 2-hydroxyacid dehydrogenase [Phycisphaerae bacterium]|nr:putative 2-hydroxyacid dehydrogenase [Phycisphaerae bacterium]